jgi:hypothetical protein
MFRQSTSIIYVFLILILLEPERSPRFETLEWYISDDTCRVPRRSDNGLRRRVYYLFIPSLKRILFSFIYIGLYQNIYLKNMCKYMALCDTELSV